MLETSDSDQWDAINTLRKARRCGQHRGDDHRALIIRPGRPAVSRTGDRARVTRQTREKEAEGTARFSSPA
jgi:hypothetical protein